MQSEYERVILYIEPGFQATMKVSGVVISGVTFSLARNLLVVSTSAL